MNGSEPRRKPRKKLENGTGLTKEAESSFQLEEKDGEENAGTHRKPLSAYEIDFLWVKKCLEEKKESIP